MSFRTQRLANRFPLWTKLRRDPSSFGSRLLDTFAEGLEEESITVQKLVESFYLTTRSLGKSLLHEVILEGEDIPERVATANGFTWSYPTIVGTLGVDTFAVTKVDTLTDLLTSPSTRVELIESVTSGDRTVWESTAPTTISQPPYPERLWIVVSGSTNYTNKTSHTDRDKSGFSTITIKGLDGEYQKVIDHVDIPDDGIYMSNFAFREVQRIYTEGFNGNCVVTGGPQDLEFEKDPFRVLVFDDMEGPLKLYLYQGASNTSFVTYKADRFKLGKQYRRPGIEVIEDTEELATFILCDEDNDPVEIVSIAVSPNNTFLYGISPDGLLYIYDHTLPEFVTPSVDETVQTYVEIHPVRPYAQYPDNLGSPVPEPLWTRFARLRYPINWIEIKRIAPDATIEYLQPDRITWNTTPARISYPTAGKMKLSDWKDFKFETLYDQLGAWEYICTTKTEIDTTVSTTTVICGSLQAVTAIDTGVSSPELIYFSDSGGLIIDNGTTAYAFNEHADVYIIEEETGHVWLSDGYDSVEVT